jgi:4'-phosphopantetheinyl transferase
MPRERGALEILRPVLVLLPNSESVPRNRRHEQQHEFGRRALRRAALCVGAPCDGWQQRESGAPIPNDGWHWSVSHTRFWAAAVVGRGAVGIDVEQVRPRRMAIWNEIGGDEEWSVAGERNWENFYRIWTAKEAILKAHGMGVGYVREVHLTGRVEHERFALRFDGGLHAVEQLCVADHVASVVCGPAGTEWMVVTGRPEGNGT